MFIIASLRSLPAKSNICPILESVSIDGFCTSLVISVCVLDTVDDHCRDSGFCYLPYMSVDFILGGSSITDTLNLCRFGFMLG